MNKAIYVLSENYHQLLKSKVLKEKDSRIKILYSGDLGLIDESFPKSDFQLINKSNIKNLNLNNLHSFVFFTLHSTKENFYLIKLLRKKNIPIICFQESHQLFIQRENIFNVILSPDILVTASSLERELIKKNSLLEEDKIVSNGWIFNNLNQKKIKKSKRILIILGASDKVAPSSEETISKFFKLVDYVKTNFKEMEIFVKAHPQESLFYHKNNKNLSLKYISHKDDINLIHHNYELIFCSENTQAALDLMGVRSINLISFQNQSPLFQLINSEIILIPDSNIKIKKYAYEDDIKTISHLIDSYEFNKKFDFDGLQKIAFNSIYKPLINDAALWNSYFKNNRLSEFNLDIPNYKDHDFSYESFKSKLTNASQISIVYLITIKKVLNHQIQDNKILQDFINEFLTPINAQNYIYETLLLYLYVRKYDLEIEISEKVEIIIRNIYEALVYKILKKLMIYKIPNFLSFQNLIKNKFKINLLKLIINRS